MSKSFEASPIPAESLPLVLLNTGTLASLIGVSRTTVQKDLSRAPYRLPPPIWIPGRRSARWLLTDVEAWLKGLRSSPAALPASTQGKRKRGRPSKAEQIAKARMTGGAA